MAGSRDLRAMSLLADLRSRGLLVAIQEGRLVIAPTSRITELDEALAIEELLPELTALVSGEDVGELIEPPEELKEWLAAKHPTLRAAFYHLARVASATTGVSFPEAMLRCYRSMVKQETIETKESVP